MKKSLFTLITILSLLTSCSQYTKLQKTSDVECRYEAAKEYFVSGKYGHASSLLEDLITIFKGHRNGEESLYMLAMCYYHSGDYETASQYFKTYYTTYQRGVYTEAARFHCGNGLFYTYLFFICVWIKAQTPLRSVCSAKASSAYSRSSAI